MNKFMLNLTASNKAIKEARAKIISEDVVEAQQELIRNLKKEERELNRRLVQLSDMSPDSELSLRVVKDTFKAVEWVKDVQSIKIDLANKKVELQLAEETYKEWFEDGEEA